MGEIVRVSVIIPTFRRPRDVVRCLQALAEQSRLADEVIVVCRHDDAPSHQAVEESKKWFPAGRLVKAVAYRPGLEAALNAGLERASGHVICFSDDDAAAHPDWIERIDRHFRRDPDLGVSEAVTSCSLVRSLWKGHVESCIGSRGMAG